MNKPLVKIKNLIKIHLFYLNSSNNYSTIEHKNFVNFQKKNLNVIENLNKIITSMNEHNLINNYTIYPSILINQLTNNINLKKCEWFNNNVSKFNNKLWLPNKLTLKSYPSNKTFNNISHKFKSSKNINFEYLTSKDAFIPEFITYVPNKNFNYDQYFEKFNNKIKEIKIKATDKDKKYKELHSLRSNHIKFLEHLNDVIKTEKYEIQFNSQQIKILNNWFQKCADTYNYCVDLYNNNPNNFDTNYKTLKLKIFRDLFKDKEKNCPYDMLTDEVRIFCSNLKSCKSNLANGHIKFYRMKHKNTEFSQSALIPKISIGNKGIFKNLLGIQPNFDSNIINDMSKCDSRLIVDKIRKRYILCIPKYFKKISCTQLNSVASIDPGEKIPFVIASLDHFVKIGEDIRKPILKYQTKIKQIQRALKINRNKNKQSIKHKKNLKCKIKKTYERITNLVKELHNQTAIYLCKNYKRILIPEFRTQDMLRNYKKSNDSNIKKKARNNKLNKRVKFVLNMLAHYRFRQHLSNKCEEYGCKLEIVNESYTSLCCTKCGFLSKKYKKREKECMHCGYNINRDLNGARNIFLKNYKKIIKTN